MRYLRLTIFIGILCLFMPEAYAVQENADSCLMLLPVEQRYKGENLERFIREIEGIKARSFTGLLTDWQRLSFTEEEQSRLLEKIEGNVDLALLTYCMQEEAGDQQIDFPDIVPYLKQGRVPVRPVLLYDLDFIRLWKQKDSEGLMIIVDSMIKAGVMAQNMYDWIILGRVLDFVLDHSDKVHCQKAIEILDNALKQKTDQDLFVLKKARDNFEGKIMLIEMGMSKF